MSMIQKLFNIPPTIATVLPISVIKQNIRIAFLTPIKSTKYPPNKLNGIVTPELTVLNKLN